MFITNVKQVDFNKLRPQLRVWFSLHFHLVNGFDSHPLPGEVEGLSQWVIELEKKLVTVILGKWPDHQPPEAFIMGHNACKLNYLNSCSGSWMDIDVDVDKEDIFNRYMRETILARSSLQNMDEEANIYRFLGDSLHLQARELSEEDQNLFFQGQSAGFELTEKCAKWKTAEYSPELMTILMWQCWPLIGMYDSIQNLHDGIKEINHPACGKFETLRSLCSEIRLGFKRGRPPKNHTVFALDSGQVDKKLFWPWRQV